MKTMCSYTKCILTIFLLVLGACTTEIDDINPINDSTVLEFIASFDDVPTTKTAVQNDGKSIWWSAHERINIFYGNSDSNLFTSTNDEPVAKATFTGTIGAFTGVTESGEPNSFWATYPYNAANTCDGSSVTVTLPDEQVAKAETFADGQWLTLAKSQGLALSFYAVGAGFRFSVTKEGVTSVTFQGNNNEVLAGKAKITMDGSNRPLVQEYIEPETEITLSAPAGQTLTVGSLYYFSFFPNNFVNGFTITFNTATETGTRVYNAAVNFNRTDVHRGRNFDQNVEYISLVDPVIPNTPDDYIVFADSKVKEKLVSAFDTNKDGELSLEEAQAVTSIENVFGEGKNYTYKSFDEFQFFTGVTEIPEGIFTDWHRITSITLPESIQTIGRYAFKNCDALESIGISSTVTKISLGAFSGCRELNRVNISDISSWCAIDFFDWSSQPLTSAHHLFLNGKEISYLEIPNNVTAIGKFAFYGCTSLVSVNIPNSVTSLGNCSFSCCYNLISVIFPNSELRIGNSTFESCTNLASIYIPENVTSIGKNVFRGCAKMLSFNGKYASDDHRCLIVDGRLCDFASYGLSSYTIPNNVTCIGAEAFSGYTTLSSIIIPNSVTTIESRAFYECADLASVAISSSVSSIGYNAFFNISDTLQLTTNVIGSQLFNHFNASAINLFIAEGVTTIETDAYADCSQLISVVIPESVYKIGLCSFSGCNNLTSIVIPDNVSIIGTSAFADCTSLMSVVIPKSVKTIRANTFSGCTNLSAVYLPNSVTDIAFDAFENCTSLTAISLPSSVNTLGDYVFSGCTALTSVIINSTSPPTLGSSQKPMDNNNATIYVPSSSVNTYKNRSGWSQYSDRIQAIP